MPEQMLSVLSGVNIGTKGRLQSTQKRAPNPEKNMHRDRERKSEKRKEEIYNGQEE